MIFGEHPVGLFAGRTRGGVQTALSPQAASADQPVRYSFGSAVLLE
jgi:hypothetical protein